MAAEGNEMDSSGLGSFSFYFFGGKMMGRGGDDWGVLYIFFYSCERGRMWSFVKLLVIQLR